MHFSLESIRVTYQNLMNTILYDKISLTAKAYIDDMVVKSMGQVVHL